MRWFAFPLFTLFVFAAGANAQPDKPDKPAPTVPFPALPEKDAWDKLPPQKKPALPEWARVLAGPLPKTTAKMLELDYLHRANNPLGARFAARLRYSVADALKSEYGRRAAQADFERAPPVRKPLASEEIALAFAKKLTLAGSAITDEEFAELLERFTPEQVTAIVHTVAYANFHNRIILALGVKGEEPVAEPVAAAFAYDASKVKAPDRPPWDELKAAKGDGLAIRVEWSKAELEQLNAALDRQKERKLRIPLPDALVIEKLPPRERDSATKILWNTVSAGYQPELTRAWFAALYAFYEEAKVDRTFTNSMFWVVTRTNDCFY
jgi:alkylhydroperoxidase family enzyme